MAIICNGISMFDIRTTLKREAGEAITMGHSVWIDTDGLVWNCDDTMVTVCHGWALTTVALGDMLTIVTTCRMEVGTTQIIGNRIHTGNVSGGSAPSTTLTGNGIVVGFAFKADAVFAFVPIPAADAGQHA